MRGNAVGTLSIAVSVLTLAIILPYGLLVSSSTRSEEEKQLLTATQNVERQQTILLESLLRLQTRVDTCRASIEALTAPQQDGEDNEAAIEAKKELIRKQLGDYEVSLMKQIDKLEHETKRQFNNLKDLVDARSNRFLIKWHSDDGVKTSKRMATEQEAYEKFNDVGEFAKKLLMFDGSRWIVLKEYGGEKWLHLMHDDGDVQEGDGKPEITKPPGKAGSGSGSG